MITAITKMLQDVGIDPDDYVARMYLEIEKSQILRAYKSGHESDGLIEALDYYHNTYGSNTNAPPDIEVD